MHTKYFSLTPVVNYEGFSQPVTGPSPSCHLTIAGPGLIVPVTGLVNRDARTAHELATMVARRRGALHLDC